MIAILNRVAHLLMQMFPGIGGMTPTSCAGFVWTQTLLANLRAISRRTACEDETKTNFTPHFPVNFVLSVSCVRDALNKTQIRYRA